MAKKSRPAAEQQALTVTNYAPQVPARTVYLEPVESARQDDTPGLAEIIDALRRRWIVLTLLAGVGTAAGVGMALREQPVYESSSTIEVRGLPEAEGFQLNAAGEAAAPQMSHEAFVQTQVEVLSSRSLLASARETLRQQNQNWEYHSTSLVGRLRDKLGLGKKANMDGTLPGSTVAVHPLPNSRVVELTVSSTNPEFSAQLANTLIQRYLDRRGSANWETAQRNQEWLNRQLEGLKTKLRQSEDALQFYGQSSGIIMEADGPNSGQASLAKLQDELSHAQADRIQKQSSYEIASSGAVDSLPQVMGNPRLNEIKLKLTDLGRDLANLKTQYTSAYPKVAEVTAQITELEGSAQRERDSILDGIRNEFNTAERREKLLTSAYSVQQKDVLARTQKGVSYDIQKHEVDSLRTLYEELLKRSQATLVASAALNESVTVIDLAEPAHNASKPDLPRYAGMGMISFLFLGCGAVVFHDRNRQFLKLPGDSATHLRAPELAVIPDLTLMRETNSPRDWFRGLILPKNVTPEEVRERTWGAKEWSPHLAGSSPAAEAYRNAVASLLAASQIQGVGRIIMMTSPNRAEGKSTTVANMGIALAESDRRVLLIDADIRKPKLHQIFGIPNTWGLTDLLREQTEVGSLPAKSLSRPTDIRRLSILTSGPGVTGVSELLYSPRFDLLLDRLQEEFDLILIDTPPMLPVSDARIIGRRASAAVLVVRAGETPTQSALFSKQQLEADGTLLLGTILTGWDMKSKPTRGYYSMYPSYQPYGGRWPGQKDA